MRRILSLFVSLHWTIVFAALATLCAADREGGFPVVLHAIGIVAPPVVPAFMESQIVPTAFAAGFGLVALLFLWTVLTAFFDDEETGGTDEVARLAFGSAIALLTILFLTCVAMPTRGLYDVVALELAALAGSWLALSAERRMLSSDTAVKTDSVHVAAKHMALGAAHSSLLRRLHTGLLADEVERS